MRHVLCLLLSLALGIAAHGQAPDDSTAFEDFNAGEEFGEEVDMEFETGWTKEDRLRHRERVKACWSSRDFQDSVRYSYFMAEVYGPAMRDPSLPAENRRFLVHLKRYLECPTDSCGRGDRLLRPVFTHEVDSTHKCHVIAADFPPDERSVDGDGSGWGDDTLIGPRQRERLYRVVYANAPVVKYARIRRFHVLPGACDHYKGYELRKVHPQDTLVPAFCSTFDLALEWGRDGVVDSLLQEDCHCRNTLKSHCDPERPTHTFARLKGVPRLWFVVDEGGWASWYPTRGLVMDYRGQMAIALWRYQMEQVGCSCI